MPLRDSIAALVSSASPDTLVPVRWLGELLAADAGPSSVEPLDTTVDLTVEDAAKRFGRKATTVRAWCQAGELVGAYKIHGKQWRIPLAAIVAMQKAQSSAFPPDTAKPDRQDDLSAWRKHLPTKAS